MHLLTHKYIKLCSRLRLCEQEESTLSLTLDMLTACCIALGSDQSVNKTHKGHTLALHVNELTLHLA